MKTIPVHSPLSFALIVATAILAPHSAQAMIPPTPRIAVLPLAAESWIRNGAAIGGQAATDDLSLLRVERIAREGGGERVALHYGDKLGRPLRSRPGYFHFALDRGGSRVTIDLAQVTRTTVDRKDLVDIFAKSALFSSVDIVMDPQDGSTHLTAIARAPIEAFIEADSDRSDDRASRLIFDFRPIGASLGAAPTVAKGTSK